MSQAIRLYFIGFYVVSVGVLVTTVLPAAARVRPARRAPGVRRLLPVILLPVGFLVPLAALVLRAGELDVAWTPVRIVGLGASLYAAALLLGAAATLGRFLVPQAVVVDDHELVTRGPYRWVRHPAYAGDLALWLGAALGTANAVLLVAWPLYLLGVLAQVRAEEDLLAERFGPDHERYRARVGLLVPRIAG